MPEQRRGWNGSARPRRTTIQKLPRRQQVIRTRPPDEMDRAGLPQCKAEPRHMLHIAQDLDADRVFGNLRPTHFITVNARVCVSTPSHCSRVRERLARFHENLHTRLTWRLLTTIDHNPAGLAEFSKLQRSIYLGAFEHYIRGCSPGDYARIRDLKEAARLEPNWPDPAFSLGQFISRQ